MNRSIPIFAGVMAGLVFTGALPSDVSAAGSRDRLTRMESKREEAKSGAASKGSGSANRLLGNSVRPNDDGRSRPNIGGGALTSRPPVTVREMGRPANEQRSTVNPFQRNTSRDPIINRQLVDRFRPSGNGSQGAPNGSVPSLRPAPADTRPSGSVVTHLERSAAPEPVARPTLPSLTGSATTNREALSAARRTNRESNTSSSPGVVTRPNPALVPGGLAGARGRGSNDDRSNRRIYPGSRLGERIDNGSRNGPNVGDRNGSNISERSFNRRSDDSSRLNRDRNDRDDGVTLEGRVLGTSRPVDRQGRTAVGRALGSLSPNAPNRGSVTFRRPPVYHYDFVTGRYDRIGDGRRVTHVSVLLGTYAARPSYRFRHRTYYHDYYYPYYVDNVVSIGYNAFPSPYFYYGYLPSYIPSTRVYVVERPIIIRPDGYAGDTESYYLNRPVQQDLDAVLDEIRRAWTTGDIDLLLKHVRSDIDIHVYLRDKYIYSLPAEDYRDLTQDAMKNSTTTEFRWDKIDRRDNDEINARAKHAFTDNDGERRRVEVTYTLARINGAWWIAEVGTTDRNED